MLSIGKLAGGAEDYYLASVARGQEEYYIGAGEAPGYWLGEGAASLCLEGEVEAEVLRALLAGRLPGDTSPAKLPGNPKRRVAGFDLTFSAPKSVSLLYGLASEEVSRSVRESHDEAVASALCYLEAHGTRARRGAGGATRVPTTGLVGAAFRHRTSRAGDPQLHTHVLCANLVQGGDGRWSAPDARLLYYQGRAAGYLYQAVLRHELARRLGVRFGPIRAGAAEIEGISPAVMRALSTRRAAIEERLATWGVDSPSAARVAALDTRPAKQPPAHTLQLHPGPATGADSEIHAGATPDIYVATGSANNTDTASTTDGPGALRETWQAKAATLGFHPGSLADLLGRPRCEPRGEGCRANIVAELLSPAGLTAQVSSFERRDVICQVAARLPEGAPAKVLELLADEVMSAPEVVALGPLGPGGEERSSTIELLCTEERLVELAMSQKASGVALVDALMIGRVLGSHPSLSVEQRVMVEHLTSSGDGVEVVLGQAGTGKTFALLAAREAWEASGMRVRGAALAARAASELEAGAAIPSMTLAQLEAGIGQGSVVFHKDDVLVIDEAGMVGTRTLARVLEALSRSRAKAVLVGDHRQLPEIDAGGAFGALARRLAATELSVNRRQSDPWEQTALVELRSGEVSAALEAYDEAGRVHVFDTARDAQRGLVEAWYEAFSTGSDARMYAALRVDVEALNGIARSLLRSEGRLGEDCYRTASGLGFARGEDVVCLRNDRRIGVENSTRGVVLYPEEGGLAIRITSGTRYLDAAYLEEGHLGYGYASTIHKAQGATVDRAFVYATASLYREAGYVAMSRARSGTDLYVPSASFETGFEHAGRRSDDPAVEASHQGEPKVFSLTESLSVSRAKSLASDERAAPPMTPTAAHRGDPAEPRPLRPSPRAPTLRPGTWRVAPQGTGSPELPRHLPQLPRHLPEVPAHLVEVIGYPPAFLDERDTWERAAHLIESYRRRFAITGDVALGPRPSGTLQRVAFEEALAAITAHQRRQGHERALEPPSLGHLIGR